MGGCIKALLSGSRREDLDISFTTSARRRSRDYGHRTTRTKPTPRAPTATNVSIRETHHNDDTRSSSEKNRSGLSLTDINSANFHQLCVLARLSTDQAQAVVNYRLSVCGGKFSHVGQLLEVPGGGITPEKLKFMGISRDASDMSYLPKSTAVGSVTSLKHKARQVESGSALETHLHFINSANYHQLCVLARISTEQAKAIVNYRVNECGGRFNAIEQLLDIRDGGITHEKLQIVRMSKLVHHSCPQDRKSPRMKQRRHRSVLKVPVSPSQPTALFKLPIGVLHIGGDLNIPTSRCKVKQSAGEKIMRIGSWNLECFTIKKVSNLGVLEVVCMTILMNGLDVMAFQELGDEDAINKVCEELNNPTLMRVQGWSSRKCKWKCAVSEKTGRMFQGMEYNAYLWNESSGISMTSCGLLQKQRNIPDDNFFVRKPFIGTFKICDWTFTLISVHLKAAGWNGEHVERVHNEINLLSPLLQATTDVVHGRQDVILLGDFNMSPDDSYFNQLSAEGYVPLFSSDEPTNISAVNLKGNHSYDNVWITTKLHSERYTGQHKVVRRGLQHQLIEGRTPGVSGTVSNHCPIWVAFNTQHAAGLD